MPSEGSERGQEKKKRRKKKKKGGKRNNRSPVEFYDVRMETKLHALELQLIERRKRGEKGKKKKKEGGKERGKEHDELPSPAQLEVRRNSFRKKMLL